MLEPLASQSALVAVIVSIATVVALLLRSTRLSTFRFAGLATSIGAYHAVVLTTRGPLPDGSLRVVLGAAVVVAAGVFFDGVLGEFGTLARRRRRREGALGIGVGLLALTPIVESTWGTALLALALLAMLLWRLGDVLVRAARIESAAEATRLRYVGVGGIIAVLGAALDLAAQAGMPTPPIGGLVVAMYLYFISQAILVSRLLDLHELLGKVLVFGTLALILAVVYGVLFFWAGDRRGFFLSNTLVASSIILILFEPIKLRIEEAATRVFFREQLTFSRGLRRVVQRLQTTIELPQAIGRVLDDIYESKRATHASVYLFEPGGLGFTLQQHRGPTPAAMVDGRVHPQLIARLLKDRTPLLREALARRVRDGGDVARDTLTDDAQVSPSAPEAALLAGMDALAADLVIPLRVQSDVLGLLCLRDERLSDAFAADEIAALFEVANQLAINIENSRLFGVLRERDRLAALGEMSAGLAHEIRNPLAAIKGAAQELDPRKLHGDDGELMQIIVDEVNRLNSVVSEFLDYARPFRGTFIALSVNDAVRKTVQLMQHDVGAEVALSFEPGDDLPDVNGDAERLQQVLINLILNAADAMQRRGRITISTRAGASLPDAALLGLREPVRHVEIVVRDEGPGIPQHVLQQIFIPFFTTKERGTGLGLALCQRIIQHHGGQIEVRSSEGQGTTFIVRLPCMPRRATDAPAATTQPPLRPVPAFASTDAPSAR